MAIWLCGYVAMGLCGQVPKNQNVHFMFFDRYEIHIQALGDFIYGKVMVFRSSSSQIYIKIDTQNVNRKHKRKMNDKLENGNASKKIVF